MDALCSSSWVSARVTRSMEDWHRSAGPWCYQAERFTPDQQRLREKAYDRSLRAVEYQAKCPSANAAHAQQKLVGCFARFAAEALDLGRDSVDLLTSGFLPVGIQLARWARRFDPNVTSADMMQASRNAWTACGLQPLLGAPLGLTPAILGYSLIYPYSDNFLDQTAITRVEKLSFSRRFRSRLDGAYLAPANAHENSLWSLVSLIEQQFERSLFPQVFECLLAIHQAQGESIAQLDAGGALPDSEVLRLSCAKGGTSVLADACLVRGSLTAQQAEFAFAWGVLLQLGDDLQDIGEDLQRGSETLFTRAVRAGQPLDAMVAQLLTFSEVVGVQLDGLAHGDAFFKNLLRMSWRSLILMAVAQYHTLFTPHFVDGLEVHSPFRFSFLRRRRERLMGRTGLFEHLFERILTDETMPMEGASLSQNTLLPHPHEQRPAAALAATPRYAHHRMPPAPLH